MGDEGQRSLNAGMSLRRIRPVRELRESRAARTTRRIQIAHDHVIQQHIMQSARAQPPTDQMRVDIQARDFGQGGFQFDHQRR
jgi:hypothetical protein